ncbi:mannosyl-oligosaccharide alpha-1,2-mannosidase-like protein [Pseudomassariella vexata]|uniref:alpha-1,2-Mannosidase n=1 Tax=Pseudomassariella vexata TaxID=1141098 RepID=A0A1Y2DJ22_9PEZI|nr:mannosyl-oligosaccharide alpha-1,2-mannosidase-like protein [Pseudomassariella vexata]ORY59231.1 mannosyl-oligosaccharide alpha-1,2-mannosidase-like protein [Pseudomassariella vexata]
MILSRFKILTAVVVVALYFLFFRSPTPPPRVAQRPRIQLTTWRDGKGLADNAKASAVLGAMAHTFKGYHEMAWGSDGVRPISGRKRDDRNGWGCFIVDSATTLALMGMWDELELSIQFIKEIDFSHPKGLVDPFETTIRYLGGLVSLVDLIDIGIVPDHVASMEDRESILQQAVALTEKLRPAYDTPTGMPYPRVNFKSNKGEPDPPVVYIKDPTKIKYDHPAIGPARAGSNILEHRALTRLTRDKSYAATSLRAWRSLVWNPLPEPFPGMVDAPMDIVTGIHVGKDRHWDAGHDSYYEYLIKEAILAPQDEHSKHYEHRWHDAALSLRANLSSRSAHAPLKNEDSYLMLHQFIGKYLDGEVVNEMSHLAHFAPGNLLLGGRWLSAPNLITFGQALLEGCRHTYNATTTGVGPEKWAWTPALSSAKGFLEKSAARYPEDLENQDHLQRTGFWVANPKYKLRPEYVESLFYAWRITGEQRYRDWAWDAFQAIDRQCRTKYGYASLADVRVEVGNDLDEKVQVQGGLIDEEESFWAGETLKYLYLIFADVRLGSLDQFVYTTEGHPLRIVD